MCYYLFVKKGPPAATHKQKRRLPSFDLMPCPGSFKCVKSVLQLACLLIFHLGTSLSAQQPEDELLSKNPSALFRSAVGIALPVVELPEKVPAPEGKITLWADFGAADAAGVPLYVVNQTNLEQSFRTQDNDLYIKLEFKDAAGMWKRAQAHLSSWCGNSYYPVVLKPRQFFVIKGYRPITGRKQVVRYAVHGGDLTSNESEGMISEDDVTAVEVDSFSGQNVPHSIREALALTDGEPLPPRPWPKHLLEDLRRLIWYPRNELAVRQVKRLEAKVSAQPASDERTPLLKAIHDYLAKIDAPKPSPEELVQLCVNRIQDDPHADPSMTKDLAWQMITESLPGDSLPTPSTQALAPKHWKPIIPHAVAALKNSKQSTRGGGADAVLSSAWLVDALVKDEELTRWLVQTASDRLRVIAASALARRSRFATLVEFGWNQPGPVQLEILRALTYAGMDPRPDGKPREIREPNFEDKEHLFWEHCVETMPVETANALWDWSYYPGSPSFSHIFHNPLQDHFKKLATVPSPDVEMNATEASRLTISLQMLASWQLQEDDSVMNALLKHGAYIKQESWSSENGGENITTRKYFYRGIAKQALIARGQPIPGDVVLESVVSRLPKKLDP